MEKEGGRVGGTEKGRKREQERGSGGWV